MKSLILMSLFVLGGFCEAAPRKVDLLGVWDLKEFNIYYEDGDIQPFCNGVNGTMLYTKYGYMSVSINCKGKQPLHTPAEQYNYMLGYTGTYFMAGGKVFHQVVNSATQSLIGRELIRDIERLEGTELILTGAWGKDMAFEAVWERLK